MEIGTEISQKIKTAIKSKLVEFGSYVDDELPDYIMVMVANKRSQSQMAEDLHLFLGDNSQIFCDWLHDLLQKLQEVTEGAFEVKVPIKIKEEVKSESKVDGRDSEVLKISKISQKPSPIRMPDTVETNHEYSFEHPREDAEKKSDYKKGKPSEKHQKDKPKNSQTLQSAVIVQKRPTLPPSKQANPSLLKKAMKEAQLSVGQSNQGEYNPEIPASSDLPDMMSQNPDSKRRKKELLLEEHKKLQRLKSQQEESEETGEPVIELQVAEDDDLFGTEETIVQDRRIVVDKNAESDAEVQSGKKENLKKSPGKKEKKAEKRKVNDDNETNDSQDQSASASGSEDDETMAKDKQRRVKTKDKRRKPKFIVTLEGVGAEFEEKYEKENSRRKRKRKSSHKDDEKPPVLNRDVPLLPVYPPLIQGVHHVSGIVPTHVRPIAPPVQVMQPAPAVLPPLAVGTVPANTTPKSVEFRDNETVETEKEKCRFWPQCKNGNECPYYHPDVSCKHFPNCRYGKDCSYVHPPCKFGSRCTSTSCAYSHLPNASVGSSENQILCRYHPFCTRHDCPFLHPIEKPCRYGANCTRSGCPFNHSTPPPREQLKWIAPKAHVSERQFAVQESSTTPLPVQ